MDRGLFALRKHDTRQRRDRFIAPDTHDVFHGVFLSILLFGFTFVWGFSEHMHSFKHQPIGSGGDQIVTFGPGVDSGGSAKAALD